MYLLSNEHKLVVLLRQMKVPFPLHIIRTPNVSAQLIVYMILYDVKQSCYYLNTKCVGGEIHRRIMSLGHWQHSKYSICVNKANLLPDSTEKEPYCSKTPAVSLSGCVITVTVQLGVVP